MLEAGILPFQLPGPGATTLPEKLHYLLSLYLPDAKFHNFPLPIQLALHHNHQINHVYVLCTYPTAAN
jgi:hypothetical protein